MAPPSAVRNALNVLASVRLAIPLLILIAASSIVGSLIPQGRNIKLASGAPEWIRRLNDRLQLNDIFHSWWYLLLLALLGVCLLAVTLKRLPTVWGLRGRGAALGILLAHLGMLFILGALIYGAFSGIRYYVHLVEGEVTVLPPLPFVMKLDRLNLKYYSPDSFSRRGSKFRMAETQESAVTLFHHGTPFMQATAAPGRPLVAKGITLLPSDKDVGWAFDLVLQTGERQKIIPVRPWAPPLITLGLGNPAQILAHRLSTVGGGGQEKEDSPGSLGTEVFLLQPDGTSRPLGFATQKEPLEFSGWKIFVGNIRRHTGLHVYSRPEKPFLVGGLATLIVGLFGYFTRWGRQVLPRRFRVEVAGSRP